MDGSLQAEQLARSRLSSMNSFSRSGWSVPETVGNRPTTLTNKNGADVALSPSFPHHLKFIHPTSCLLGMPLAVGLSRPLVDREIRPWKQKLIHQHQWVAGGSLASGPSINRSFMILMLIIISWHTFPVRSWLFQVDPTCRSLGNSSIILLDICNLLLAGLKKRKNDVTEVSMSVANIWKAAHGDCTISIFFAQYCLTGVQWWQDCGSWLLPWLRTQPSLTNLKKSSCLLWNYLKTTVLTRQHFRHCEFFNSSQIRICEQPHTRGRVWRYMGNP